MAKGRQSEESNGKKGSIRFRYMDSERVCDFSVENVTGESVTDGLRSIANALAGRNIAAALAPKQLRRSGAGGGPAEIIDEREETEAPSPGVLPFDETPVDTAEDVEPEGGAQVRPKQPRKLKAPKVLDDPKLNTAGVSLADFLKEKGSPTEMFDKYSAVAVWYKQQFNITEMNIDRIYTAFKHLGQDSQLPANVEKPLMNLTYQKQWFAKTKNPGCYEIKWLGEDAVNKMGAPKSATASA
jgi:hypothetical protein